MSTPSPSGQKHRDGGGNTTTSTSSNKSSPINSSRNLATPTSSAHGDDMSSPLHCGGSHHVDPSCAAPQSLEDIQREIARMQSMNGKLENTIDQRDTEIQSMREKVASAQQEAEVSEDNIANRMLRRLDSMKKEKQQAAQKLRQEEGQRARIMAQIAEVQGQKVELENTIEQEQEYIMHQLQRQLLNVSNNRMELEKRLQDERQEYLNVLRVKVSEASKLVDGSDMDLEDDEELEEDAFGSSTTGSSSGSCSGDQGEYSSSNEEEVEDLGDASGPEDSSAVMSHSNASFVSSLRLSPVAQDPPSSTPPSDTSLRTPTEARPHQYKRSTRHHQKPALTMNTAAGSGGQQPGGKPLKKKERAILNLEENLNALLSVHVVECERVKDAELHCKVLGEQLHQAQVDALVERNRAYKLRADLQNAQNELAYVQAHSSAADESEVDAEVGREFLVGAGDDGNNGGLRSPSQASSSQEASNMTGRESTVSDSCSTHFSSHTHSGASTPLIHNSLVAHTKQILSSANMMFPKPRRSSISPARSTTSSIHGADGSVQDEVYPSARSRNNSQLQTPPAQTTATSPLVPQS